MRLVVGLGTLKAGQKGMVDIDGTSGQFAAQVVAQYLHIAGQYDQLGAFALNNFQLLDFRQCLAVRRNRHMVEGHVVAGGQLVKLAVVGNNGPDINR